MQTNLVRLLSDLVEGYASMAAPGVHLQSRVGAGVPAFALIDPMRVQQVLANGLTNALKHTIVGRVTLQVSMSFLRLWVTSMRMGYSKLSLYPCLVLALSGIRWGSQPCRVPVPPLRFCSK